ncbi:unnamed protein product [Paramecium primaurelia]|uniref:C2 domain containing protein n=1 Tax=Paramecium primaurelia TaxID=5886 RepID=A0A8S1LRF6_PARPR|nr:unnamed protein product [Paramecium primaurelia]
MDQQAMTNALGNLKRQNEIRQQQKQQSSIPDQQTESNVYNDDFDGDDAILNVIKTAQDQKPKQQPQSAQPKRPESSNKRTASMPKKKPYSFNKLNEGEKEKLFLDVYDENIKLKENQVKFEKMYGTMEVKLQQMQKFMGNKTVGAGETSESNNQLVSKVNNLETENEKLKQKIQAISQAQRVVVAHQPMKKKKLVQADRPDIEQTGIRGGQFVDQQNQIKQLLDLNDKLKKRLLEQEAQFRQLQAMMNSKIVNQQELSQKNAQFVTLQERCNKLESNLNGMRTQLDDERKRQSEIMMLLREEKEKNHLLEGQVRSMELAQKSVVDLQADLQEARRQKKEIEERLAILMESPFFKEYNERATIQAKMKAMEQEQIRNATDLKNLRETNAKLETENRLKREDIENLKKELKLLQERNQELNIKMAEKDQQLLPFKDLNYWDNDQFLKVLGNLKWTGEDPAWRKIEFIDRTYMDSDDPVYLRKEIEHLKLEKGELAAHLEKTQTLLKNQQDIQMEKDKMHQTQIEQLKLELKVANEKAYEYAKIADLKTQARQQQTLYEAEGIKYDDSISVFSVDKDEMLSPGENFFDLWIGKGEYQPAELVSSYKTSTQLNLDLGSLLTFVTIDFYDHETQHTSVSEGTSCFYNLQISFKVDADANFIQYLESNYLKLELYVSQGSEPTKIGSGLIQLKDLVYENKNDTISKVISGSLTFHGINNQMIGIVEFKARMRFPISNFIRLLKERNQLQMQEFDEAEEIVAVRKRKLVICIEKGTSLPSKSNCFIYYNFDTKDFHTNTQMGSNPKWDYRMVHDIVYNEMVVNQFNRMPLELYIIDDNQPLVEGSNDKVGFCLIDLSPLVKNQMIDLAAEVKNDDGDKVASVYVKIFWYDIKDEDTLNQQRSMIAESWEENITHKISSEMRSRGLLGITAFRVFDKDQDQIITFEDFANGLKNVLSIKMNPQEMQVYYSKLPQPLNQQKFQEFFRLQSNESVMYEAGFKSQYQTQELSSINQLMQQNTMQLQRTQLEQIHNSIYDLLKRKLSYGKSVQELFMEIDSVKPDGQLTIDELQKYFQQNSLLIPIAQLRDFLKFYMDINNDQLINFREFANFFKLIPTSQQQQVYSQSSFRQGSNQRVQSNFPSIQDTQLSQSPIEIAITAILNYGQARQWTLMQVREFMDENRNSFIEANEMKKFLIQFGVHKNLQNGDDDIRQIIGYFDINHDGRISISEFADTLNTYNTRLQIIKAQPTQQNIQNYVVGYLITYMRKHRKTVPELFNDIDQDGNGYLSKVELKNIFKNKILVPVDEFELNELFMEFDKNKDGHISISEFLQIVKPALDQDKNELQFNQQGIDKEKVARKAEEICFKNARVLQLAFQSKAQKPGYVTEAQFKQILKETKVGFTPNEIDDLTIYVIQPENGMINYNQFLDLGKLRGAQQSDIFGQTSRSGFGSLSQIEQERAIGKAKEVFNRISRAVKNKYTPQQLFATFDKDSNGKINKAELAEVFSKMKIKNLDKDDVELIFKALDRDEDGQIDVKEFIKYLE